MVDVAGSGDASCTTHELDRPQHYLHYLKSQPRGLSKEVAEAVRYPARQSSHGKEGALYRLLCAEEVAQVAVQILPGDLVVDLEVAQTHFGRKLHL